GETHGFVASDTPERRGDAVGRWQTWLKDSGKTAKLNPVPRDLGPKASRLLLCLFDPYRVEELDLSGKRIFANGSLNSACGCQGLENGHRVFADWGTREVVEMDAQGKVVWRKPVPGTPNCLHRLPNGNTLVGLFLEREVCEIKPDGSVAWRAKVAG